MIRTKVEILKYIHDGWNIGDIVEFEEKDNEKLSLLIKDKAVRVIEAQGLTRELKSESVKRGRPKGSKNKKNRKEVENGS